MFLGGSQLNLTQKSIFPFWKLPHIEHLEIVKTQAGNLPPNMILSGFQGAAASTHLPCDALGPFLLRYSSLSGSGSISGRMRSSQDLEEVRQKPLDFVFLVEGE